MIVRNCCLSVSSVKHYYFSLLFVNFNPSYAEQSRFSCLFSGKEFCSLYRTFSKYSSGVCCMFELNHFIYSCKEYFVFPNNCTSAHG